MSSASVRIAIIAMLSALSGVSHGAARALVVGDPVRVTRSEMLLFQGKNLAGAAKGQEFTLLKHDAAKKQVFVSFMKDDGTLVAATLPDEAVEPGVVRATSDLVRGVEAFRDQRYDEAKRLLTRAALDKQHAALAGALFTRVNGAFGSASLARTSPAAKQAATTTLQTLRDTAEGLAKAGMTRLALALDEGTDRLGAQVPGLTVPATKADRADLTKRAAISRRETMLARQSFALKQLVAASKHVAAGLEAEPAHYELKAMQPLVQKDLEEADTLFKTAKKMQRQPNGAVHALSAIDDGLKLCTDHADLRELRKTLAAAFEEKTSPQVTPAFVSIAKAGTSAPMLEEGRKLYTVRCTECHDLEMLDGRTLTSLSGMVGSMSRRAGLSDAEKTRILDYIAAAKTVVDAGGAR
ncbi:MAG: hypothetical protein NTV08_08935 [Verrucomicrobia bacterium]|nr:hypothetical protein [Verrucomicrobiota bacterium]